MRANIQTDVLIVGAGPTGLSLACQLVRYGIDFVIVDKKEGVTPYSKALGVHARTLEIYEQMGLSERAISEGTIAGRVRLLEGGDVKGEVDLSAVGEGMSPYPFMLVLEQSRNEQLLYGFLKHNSKDVRWQTELASFEQTEEEVTAILKGPDGAVQTVEARYLVGCDGPSSPVRHSLGLGFEGSTFERIFYVADVKIDWKYPHDALHVCLTRNAVVAFFPMQGENRWRIVGAFPEGTDKEPGEVLYEEIEARIKLEAEVELDITEVNWFSTYKVHSRHVERFSEGRCFLAGDSAHIHTPAGGQGMNTGIQDAYNLAWKLAFVLNGQARPEILTSYNDERLPNAKRLLETTDRMFNLAAGSDWLLHLIRTTIFPPLAGFILGLDAVKKRFFPLISQIGIHYPDSMLSQRSEGSWRVKAGDRMPWFKVEGGSVYDLLRAPRFHLVTFSEGQSDGHEAPEALGQEFPDAVDHIALPLTTQVTERFGTEEPFTILLRPDNHVALLAAGTSGDEARRYLRDVIGCPPKA
jgi:2-polyprenyl-6-methoxyphenol hydroxylase-like FAD-dependent oxidoreductase